MDTLLDSNVLIRAHDPHAEPYAKSAENAIREYALSGRAALSAQGLAEFVVYATLYLNMPEPLLLEQVQRLRALFPVLPLTADVVEESVRLLPRYGHIGVYDMQVRAMADQNGLRTILSEIRAMNWRSGGIHYKSLLRDANVHGWTPTKQGYHRPQMTAKATPSTPPPFTGFDPDAFAYFRELHLDNTKAFWEANRHRYEEHVKAPLLALATELAGAFGEGHLYRPYRDVRFSKDKRPYKERAALSFGGRGPSAVGGQYIQIAADGLFIGVGSYMMQPEHLAFYRRAVSDDLHGARLEEIVADLLAAGYAIEGETLVRTPRPYDKDHPRADLLKRKGIFAATFWPQDEWMYQETALERVAATFAGAEPLATWLRARLS